ncbi:MAG TPA: tRNA (cytidine(56)-2'-O)-methyltransferase [Nitrososphaerales archaeon]|nr:tRNA (cytidine(56)-2'-O)-methyltransferase [Nitrososphaerales archaeon]
MTLKSVRVVRVGHRYVRDYRTLTHLCLVSRALGAEAVYLEEVERELVETVGEVNKTWGGDFKVLEGRWKKVFQDAKDEGRTVIHLTMYGSPLQEVAAELRRKKRFLIAVGGPKVPKEVYQAADYNVAVTSQPHSEIAALAITVHELQKGEELKKEFGGYKLRIVPSARGKRVEH